MDRSRSRKASVRITAQDVVKYSEVGEDPPGFLSKMVNRRIAISMPSMSAADKQRLYRMRRDADPLRRERYLINERRAWQARKDSGKVKTLAQLSEREKRNKRKYWKKAQARSREQRSKNALLAETLSPPSTPDASAADASALETLNSTVDSAKLRGRKRVKKMKSKLYRELFTMRIALRKQTRKTDMYKKRLQRLNEKTKNNMLQKDSPRSKTKKVLSERNSSEKVRKTLTFHYALIRELRNKYTQKHSNKEKQIISKVIKGNVLKKYKLLEEARRSFGFSRKRFKTNCNHPRGLGYHRKQQRNLKRHLVKGKIQHFLEQDINSRATSGKKETITQSGVKMQKRFLSKSLRDLHKDFCIVNPFTPVSYSMFCYLRPFWIMHPRINDRETCLCNLHENLNFQYQRLVQLGILKQSSLDTLVEKIVCDRTNKLCMYRECAKCKDMSLLFDLQNYTHDSSVWFWKWGVKSEEREKLQKGEKVKFVVKVTRKEKVDDTLGNLIKSFQETLKQKFTKHVYNHQNQYRWYRKLVDNTCNASPNDAHCDQNVSAEGEVIIHIDFSENYQCKFAAEVQSVHFGASNCQASLHTGIMYCRDKNTSPTIKVPFCTISSSKRHDPSAIWGHLDPILKHIRTEFPNVSTVHFFSDGPTTQYRNKKNFYLFSNVIYDFGFQEGSWNLFEASHGKGAADGIGAAIKQRADRLVSTGTDIPDAFSLFNCMINSDTTIKLFYIRDSDIDKFDDSIPAQLTAIPNTMQLHQLVTSERNIVHCRVLSCFCSYPHFCQCHTPLVKSFDTSAMNRTKTSQNVCISENTAEDTVFYGKPEMAEPGVWCIVQYDDCLYPGIVCNIDNDDGSIEINVIHKSGQNKFVYPKRPDKIWYSVNDVLCTINEPTMGKRFLSLDKKVWDDYFA